MKKTFARIIQCIGYTAFLAFYFFCGVCALVASPLVRFVLEPLGLGLYHLLATKTCRRRRYKKWLRGRGIQTLKGRLEGRYFAPVETDLVRHSPIPSFFRYNEQVHREYLEDINPFKWVIKIFSLPGNFVASFP